MDLRNSLLGDRRDDAYLSWSIPQTAWRLLFPFTISKIQVADRFRGVIERTHNDGTDASPAPKIMTDQSFAYIYPPQRARARAVDVEGVALLICLFSIYGKVSL